MYRLFSNAQFYTLNQKQPQINSLLVHNGHIVFCGDEASINLPQKFLKRIDLKGKTVIPSFTDCHTHFVTTALKEEQVDLDDCPSIEKALKIITKYVNTIPDDKWILGGGWNSNIWHGRKPHKKFLDEITSKNPVVLFNKDVHTVWANSMALKLAGIDKKSPDPTGGKIDRDTNGELTGLLFDNACRFFDVIIPERSEQDIERCLIKFSSKLHRLGITAVHSCESMEDFALFQKLYLHNKLKIRICMHPPVADKDKLIRAKIFSGFGNEWLRIGGLKYFVDGSLGSQTAEMFDNYFVLNYKGIEVIKQEELTSMVENAASHGLAATIHAIGDKANNKALNAITSAQKINSPVPLRYRIEHAQTLLQSDIQRFKTLNVMASMQPLHLVEDVKIADKYLGAERARFTFPIKSLLDAGARVIFGSDMPVAHPDPVKGIRAAVSRKYLLNEDEPAWYPEQCVSVKDAVHAYTREAAYASYEENKKGTLEAGKIADFIVLSGDIFNLGKENLKDIKVLATVLNGDFVYRSDF